MFLSESKFILYVVHVRTIITKQLKYEKIISFLVIETNTILMRIIILVLIS